MTALVLAVLLAATAAPTPPAPTPALTAAPAAASFDHDHSAWTRVLAARLHEGRVDYTGLARDPAAFDAYLGELQALSAAEYSRFSREQRLAFWINVYNAYTVKLILDHWPVASIRKIGGLFKSPFKIEFIPLEKLRDRRLSLDTVEHEILRREFHDARVHATIVCASRSCPTLRSDAYRASTIDAQLDQAMRGFLADPRLNRFEAKSRTLYLSSIFKWFREDFEQASGTLTAYVSGFVDEATSKALRERPVEIDFLSYDWSINGR